MVTGQLSPPPLDGWFPIRPESIKESGLTQAFIEELLLKIMYSRGKLNGHEIAQHAHLPFASITSTILDYLKRELMCEVKGSIGLGSSNYQYTLTSKGSSRARELLKRNTYASAAPVPWDDYVMAINAQGTEPLRVNPDSMRESLANLVLEESVFDKIGPAVNSGKSIFLYGPPGNGKTTIAENIGRMVLTNDIYIPYAIEVDGQIIQLYDAINHQIIDEPTYKIDSRWVHIKRPVIMVGGELTLAGLELVYDPINKYYEAPYQMKANGGMFLIDDFGRQQVRPHDLLNRWIVPMEKEIDFLSLHTGRKVEVPFKVLIVFSTNLPPRDLVDEAFLRRIRHKIEITSPTFTGYRTIFQRVARARSVPYDEKAVRYLLKEYYVDGKHPLRANHPRDLIDQLIDIANYRGEQPRLTKELLDLAADSFFVKL